MGGYSPPPSSRYNENPAIGGSGGIFASEAYIKDPINAESTLFTELKNFELF